MFSAVGCIADLLQVKACERTPWNPRAAFPIIGVLQPFIANKTHALNWYEPAADSGVVRQVNHVVLAKRYDLCNMWHGVKLVLIEVPHHIANGDDNGLVFDDELANEVGLLHWGTPVWGYGTPRMIGPLASCFLLCLKIPFRNF